MARGAPALPDGPVNILPVPPLPPQTGGPLTPPLGGFDPNYNGGGGSGVPNLDARDFTNQSAFARNMQQDIFNRATGGTINSYNTAANRLRERLDASAAGQMGSARNSMLSRGFGASGLNDAQQRQIAGQNQNAYAMGLSDLEDNFETQRQKGLETGLGAANSAVNLGQLLAGLQNNREQRTFTGDQAASDRDLQRYLAQFGQQNQNQRDYLNQLMNIPGLFTNIGQLTPFGGSGSSMPSGARS